MHYFLENQYKINKYFKVIQIVQEEIMMNHKLKMQKSKYNFYKMVQIWIKKCVNLHFHSMLINFLNSLLVMMQLSIQLQIIVQWKRILIYN